ncbi:MAG: ankyrin repeat domain-containing protein [Gemmataceae bacterium]
MRYCLALSLLTVLIFNPPTKAVEGRNQDDLSLAIVVGKDESGASVIRRDGKFQIVFANRSDEPIRLWSEECRFGHDALSFRFTEEESTPALMRKRLPGVTAWRNQPPKTIVIPAGGTFHRDVHPAGFFWGERAWIGGPEPNTGKPVTLTAVFEIAPTDATKAQGVWTGRVTSAAVTTLVVDPNLRTPHNYLWNDCPKQAYRMILADPTWSGKRDENQCTPLHHAVRFNFVDLTQWLLTHDADINARAYNQFTPLHFASESELVKLLLKHKADINAKDVSGRTALEGAARKFAQFERVPGAIAEREKWRIISRILLEAGADYDLRSACYLDDVERVRALVTDKEQARNKETMRFAATHGQAKIVKLLLEHGADPEDGGYDGLTVSYFAIEHAEVLKLLFDAGADPKVVVEYRGSGLGSQASTLLHAAAGKGSIESAKLLLAHGVNVDVSTATERSPLYTACGAGQAEMVEWLLQNKANANARTKDGWTPMMLATKQVRPNHDEENAKYQAVIRVLERASVKLDAFAAIACNDIERMTSILRVDRKVGDSRDPAGRPALHRAVMLDRREIVKLMLDNGADPNIRSQEKGVGYDEETALLEGAFWGRLEIAEMLLNRGANVNAKAAEGVVPLHEASRMGHIELARLLLKHGADANAIDNKGKSPLDWARESPEMAKLLRDHGGAR